MKPPAVLAALAALSVAVATTIAPAFAARSSYVIDDAHLLSQGAIAQINQQISSLVAQTGKEVVVVTVPSLDGVSGPTAIERSFAQLQVNGVEIFVAKAEHDIRIAGDTASSQFFPSGSYQTIAQTMRTSFRAGDYDGGVENAAGVIVNTYRGHASSLRTRSRPVSYSVQRSSQGSFGMGWIWWIIILAVIFFIIRGIFRAMAGPRMYGPGPGQGYGGGPGYGGPGYGGYGGGGGFWSGLLGGLGGAWLGNEIFGNRGGFGGGYDSGNVAGVDNSADAGGWQSDPGQIDTSNIGGASFGDSGGGDSGGGWGGGGDFGGGGGGDSGGGW